VEADPVVRRYRNRLPKALERAPGAAVSFDGGVLTVTGPAGGSRTATFFPDERPGVTYGKAEVAVRDDRFTVTVRVDVNRGNARGDPVLIAGLVALGERPEGPCYDFQLPADVPSR
jgi:hypothetical protein